MKTITLTSKGQITIPAAVRRQLDLSDGDRLSYQVHDSILVIKPQTSFHDIAKQNWQIAKHYIHRPITDQDVRDAIQEKFDGTD